MPSVKENMVYFAASKGDNKSVMCRKIKAHVTAFRGDNLQQGVKTDTLVIYISIYSDVDIYWLLNISDVLQEKNKSKTVEESDEVYNLEHPKKETTPDSEFMIEVLNRNNISLIETKNYLLNKLKENENNS